MHAFPILFAVECDRPRSRDLERFADRPAAGDKKSSLCRKPRSSSVISTHPSVTPAAFGAKVRRGPGPPGGGGKGRPSQIEVTRARRRVSWRGYLRLSPCLQTWRCARVPSVSHFVKQAREPPLGELIKAPPRPDDRCMFALAISVTAVTYLVAIVVACKLIRSR